MSNDLGDQPKPQEDQPKERVIEVNEWFTPFENYDDIPYDKPDLNDPEQARYKRKTFKLANVGNFRTTLWWEPYLVDPEGAEGESYILVLPASEKVIDGTELQREQEKMETRPMKLEVDFVDEKFYGKSLPYNLEVELPSGTVISAGMDYGEADGPSAFDNWTMNREKFHGPVIPDIENLIAKLNFRFIPKE